MLSNWRKVGYITRDTRKLTEGEKVADGFVVMMKRSNVLGVKEPY
jgi:hypothetical protein